MYIFRQAKDASFHLDKYPELLKTSNLKCFFYAIFFVMLSFISFVLSPILLDYNKYGGFDTFINESIPNFTVVDNKILVDEYYKKDIRENTTLIFSPKNSYQITSEDEKDAKDIIIKVSPSYVSSNLFDVAINTGEFLEVLDITDKTDLLGLKPMVLLSFILGLAIACISYILSFFLGMLLVSVWINLFSTFYELKMPFKDIFKLTIYINTTPLLLKVVLGIISLFIPHTFIFLPSFVYLGILISYLYFVLKIFKEQNLYKADLK